MIISDNQPPIDSLSLDAGTVRSVVEHMNSDHAEACLAIVRAFSEQGATVLRARLLDMDKEGLIFGIQIHDEPVNANDQTVRVNFSKPLRNEAQIRGALVGMTRQARQKLADQQVSHLSN